MLCYNINVHGIRHDYNVNHIANVIRYMFMASDMITRWIIVKVCSWGAGAESLLSGTSVGQAEWPLRLGISCQLSMIALKNRNYWLSPKTDRLFTKAVAQAEGLLRLGILRQLSMVQCSGWSFPKTDKSWITSVLGQSQFWIISLYQLCWLGLSCRLCSNRNWLGHRATK